MFCVDGLERFMVSMHFHVPSRDMLVESLKSTHDAQHFAFNIGVATFCFSQRLAMGQWLAAVQLLSAKTQRE